MSLLFLQTSTPNFEKIFKEFANAEIGATAANRRASSSSSCSGKTSPAPSSTGSTDGAGLLSGAPVRRYKQYTEDSLQQVIVDKKNLYHIKHGTWKDQFSYDH